MATEVILIQSNMGACGSTQAIEGNDCEPVPNDKNDVERSRHDDVLPPCERALKIQKLMEDTKARVEIARARVAARNEELRRQTTTLLPMVDVSTTEDVREVVQPEEQMHRQPEEQRAQQQSLPPVIRYFEATSLVDSVNKPKESGADVSTDQSTDVTDVSSSAHEEDEGPSDAHSSPKSVVGMDQEVQQVEKGDDDDEIGNHEKNSNDDDDDDGVGGGGEDEDGDDDEDDDDDDDECDYSDSHEEEDGEIAVPSQPHVKNFVLHEKTVEIDAAPEEEELPKGEGGDSAPPSQVEPTVEAPRERILERHQRPVLMTRSAAPPRSKGIVSFKKGDAFSLDSSFGSSSYSSDDPSYDDDDEASLEDTRANVCGALEFYDIEEAGMQRLANKLLKKLNHDPWDEFKKYNDEDVFDFIQQHPETCGIKYDFESFSGYIFPISMLCTLGASPKTIEQAYLAYKPALDECDVWIGTPLHYACSYKAKSTVINFLVGQNPAMLQKMNQFGRTPLHMACLFKAPHKTVSVLLQKYPRAAVMPEKDGYTPLHLACENGSSAEVVRLLSSTHPDTCLSVNHKGCTPLHLACEHNASKAVLQVLLEICPDASLCHNSQGMGPLHVAVKHNATTAMIRLLGQSEPECLELPTSQGHTAYRLAKRSGASEAVLELLAV